MKELLLYFIQTMFCAAAFLLLYKTVVLRRATFRFSRAYLIAFPIASLMIPLLNVPVYPARQIVITIPSAIDAAVAEAAGAAGTTSQVAGNDVVWRYIYLPLYIAVAAIFTGLIFNEFVRVRKIRRNSRATEHSGCRVYESPFIESPFSTAKSIYLGDALETREKEQIIAHESSHIRHGHFYERLFMTIMRMLLWFNPFVWIARRYLIELHEYQADSDVLAAGYDMTEYRKLILNQILGYNPDITCGLNSSLTKKRFLMMTTKKLKRGRVLRIAAPLLMTGGLVMLFGFTAKPDVYTVQPEPQAEVLSQQTSTIVVRGTGTTQESMENMLPKPEEQHRFHITRDAESKRTIAVYLDPDGVQSNPLILVDGIEEKSMDLFAADMIMDVTVLKGAAAVEKYGERAKDGVIEITTKKTGDSTDHKEFLNFTYAEDSSGNAEISAKTKIILKGDAKIESPETMVIIKGDPATETSGQTNVIYIKDSSLESMISGSDGKEKAKVIVNGVGVDNIDYISADTVAYISILKGSAAIEKYGKNAKDGVISIATIENTDNVPAILPIDSKKLKGAIGRFDLQSEHPVTKEVRAHTGVDLPTAKEVAVYATADGTVLSAENIEGYGNLLTVDHGNGYKTRYAHLGSFNVKSGDTVKRGEVIGKVGSSGRSAGPHLHYEVIYRGQYVDPVSCFGGDIKEIERLANGK